MSACLSAIPNCQSLIEFAKGIPVGLAAGASIRYLSRNHPHLSPPALCVIANLGITLLAEREEESRESEKEGEREIRLAPQTAEELAQLAGASFGFVLALTAKISKKNFCR